jgi:type I restriction enzyme M protein
VVKNREVFTARVKAGFRKAGHAVPASLFKAILAALSERDETADVCADARGNPEPGTPSSADCALRIL